jgi:secreted trypsin-like serine protease
MDRGDAHRMAPMGAGGRLAVRIPRWLAASGFVLLLAALAASPAVGGTTAQTSIVNGTQTPIAALPSLAFIKHKAPSYVRHGGPPEISTCTGTVVAPRIVLTAGHCVQSPRGNLRSTTGFRVTTGVGDIRSAPAGSVSHVSRALIIPGYNPSIRRYDVGLLVLSAPVAAPAMRLAQPGDAGLLAENTPLTIAGWGLPTKPPADPSSPLRAGQTTIGSTANCEQYKAGEARGFYPEFEFCAFATPQSKTISCKGDDGGPGIVKAPNGAEVQVGVISSQAADCAVDEPEVLTRVDVVSYWVGEWIAAIERGGREPRVSLPKVTLPRMSKQMVKSFAPQALAWSFRHAFSDRRDGSFELGHCVQPGRLGMKCDVSWIFARMRWHGRVSFHFGTTREGRIVNFSYRIAHLNKTCLKKYRGTRRCIEIIRGH